MGLPSAPEAPGPPQSQFLGLQSSWIPLRKVHKDSRLRFLTPAEMLNPTVWDVQFLNSVMMRASEPRLFITHPDAYLQDFQSYETGWTWQRVRELTRVYTENESSQQVPEADALEDCWAWTDTLDELPGTQTSMSMRNERSRLRASTGSPAVQNMTSWRSSSPVVGVSSAGQSLIRRNRRPSYIRTTSVPLEGVGGHPSPMTTARRRVMSGGHSRRASPSVRGGPQFAVSKRRRARSPSYARFTPRFTTSPSPMPMSHERHYVRGTTPFAYATPHSNAPLQEARTIRAGSAAPVPAEYMADMAYDELYEIEIYESDSEMSFGEDEDDDEEDEEDNIASANLSALVPHAQPQRRTHLPEDEPWPGIEDQEQQMSDGENVDPAEDRRSVASSQPSEYPSTNRAWPEDTAAGFRIHEDA
ncbi:uncharacterized protein J7T54_003080 [Emericellopsis cladophorae]|uniref:Uncharacterized protein n=1 Tax=Emericellopsis cladophorae TaxID=2686198 RepID=A0A9P9Y0H6_9HYPO|nr:uncharacterized protein J7T54_003080 [Emericellopsis cladophorae]KAI6780938.1 hypothetical protein J7T54_003080 [Emericellopsis cladophorae]